MVPTLPPSKKVIRIAYDLFLNPNKTCNVKTVQLVSVNKSLKFWQKLGFVPQYEFLYTPEIPAIKMELELTGQLLKKEY